MKIHNALRKTEKSGFKEGKSETNYTSSQVLDENEGEVELRQREVESKSERQRARVGSVDSNRKSVDAPPPPYQDKKKLERCEAYQEDKGQQRFYTRDKTTTVASLSELAIQLVVLLLLFLLLVLHPHTFSSVSSTKDLQIVNLTLRVLSRPEVMHLPQIVQTLGLEYDEKVLPSIGNEVLKVIVAQFNVDQLLT
ncbi:hypothetical protein SO802_012943 [Lithocarpus litseifolius]|uniref:Prohibitin n=1 Tax=Lithocarpus litseifolius TaxID=425828 RepID=A0AAW2D4T6_9ROSI